MADEVQKRKAVAEKTGTNWLSKPYTAYTAHVEKQRKLFEALNAFVSEQGGWVVSPPGDRRVRIESPQASGLPIRLAERGFVLRYITTATRNTGNGVVPTDIFELTLPR
jgi:hypothetical protein